jgi:diguanylate cyclase (GGDEF)-like protein
MARVLVVEDDDAALELLTRELESVGHDVHAVRDGEEAYVALFRAWPAYDLLVCDVELSRMPGRDLLARVAAQVRSRTPVLVVGGNERLLDGLGEVEEWIFDILRKPIEPENLHPKVERALAHRETLRVGEDAQSGIEQVQQRLHELERRVHDLARQNVVLFQEARLDALTRLPNRRRFEEDMGRKYANTDRYGAPFAIALCDVDDFRQFNEHLGYEGGDRAIRHVAFLLTQATRGGDVVYRYGGDEFVVVMEAQNLQQGLRVAGRLVESVGAAPVPENIRGVIEPITISAGVAAVAPGDVRSAAAFVREANRFLSQAKQAGGNCVRPRPSEDAPEPDPSRSRSRPA